MVPEKSAFYHDLTKKLYRFELGYVHELDENECRCPFHHHFYTEIVYHRKGGGTTALDSGKRIDFDERSVVVYAPGVVHNQIVANAGAVDVVLHVEELSDSGQDDGRCLYAEPSRVRGLENVIEELAGAGPQNSGHADAGLSLKASYLMHELRMRCESRQGESKHSSMSTIVHETYDYIREHYQIIRSFPAIADTMGVGYEVLRKAFRKEYGISMQQWFSTVRIRQAEVLLRNTILTQRVIAQLCGFNDEQHLSAEFRKRAGLTPGALRKKQPLY